MHKNKNWKAWVRYNFQLLTVLCFSLQMKTQCWWLNYKYSLEKLKINVCKQRVLCCGLSASVPFRVPHEGVSGLGAGSHSPPSEGGRGRKAAASQEAAFTRTQPCRHSGLRPPWLSELWVVHPCCRSYWFCGICHGSASWSKHILIFSHREVNLTKCWERISRM